MINEKYLNSKNDFYFGNLEKYSKNKMRSFKLMINHTNRNSSYLNSKKKKRDFFILEKYLDLKYETLILLKKIFTVFELLYLLLSQK